MKKTFLILTFLLSSIFVIGQNTFSTGNMGKFYRIGNNFRYLPYAGLHYTMLGDSVIIGTIKFTGDNSILTSANFSGLSLWQYISPGSSYIIPKNNKGIIGDTVFSSDSVPILRCYTTNRNVFLGYGTANDKRITGVQNTLIGYIAGRDLLTGTNNTFIGERAGIGDTSGSYNIFIGQNSGSGITNKSNRLGISSMDWMGVLDTTNHIIWGIQDPISSNQFIWFNAHTKIKHSLMVYNDEILDYDTVVLKNDTTPTNGLANKTWVNNKFSTIADRIAGDKWTLVEIGSQYINTTNSVITDSLFSSDSIRSANFNDLNHCVLIGRHAGEFNNNVENTFIGHYSGNKNKTGYSNTYIGNGSGQNNVGGQYNTSVGASSGYVTTTGNMNTLIGSASGSTVNIGSNNLFIGYNSGTWMLNQNNKLVISSIAGRLTIADDTTGSIIYGYQNTATINQRLYLNSNVYVTHSLLVNSDTVFVKNDTSPTNGLATKLWTDNKFFTLASGTLKLNISDTASLVLGKTRASEIYSTIADRIAGDKWGLVSPGSGYINVLNSKKIIATSFYSNDSIKIAYFDKTNSNIFLGENTGRTNSSGTCNTFVGSNSGYYNSTGYENTFIGLNAGFSTDAGYENTYIGSGAGYGNVNGFDNIAIGKNSGKYLTTEHHKIIFDNRDRGSKLLDTTTCGAYISTSTSMGSQYFYHNGNVVYTPVNTGDIVAGTGITQSMLSAVIIYNGSSAIDISANPQIVAGKPGQIITIIGTSDANALTLENGTGILSSGTRVLGLGDNVTYIYIGSPINAWDELHFNNN